MIRLGDYERGLMWVCLQFVPDIADMDAQVLGRALERRPNPHKKANKWKQAPLYFGRRTIWLSQH